jgi:hypothetical protein
MDELYRLTIFLAFLFGCAQPSAVPADGGRSVRRDGGQLQFEEDGGTGLPDLSNSSGQDLARAPDLAPLPDMALPPGADLAGMDLATPPDLASTVVNCFSGATVPTGCPDTITIGADAPLTQYGGGGGGAATPTHCPANQVAVGFELYFDDNVFEMSGVGVFCSPVTLVRGTSTYSLGIAASSTQQTPIKGGTVTPPNNDYNCPVNQAIWTTLMDTSSYVDGLGLSCGLGTLTLASDNKLSINFVDQNSNLGYDYGGGTQHPQSCPPSSLVVGYAGRTGSYMDAVQPICAPLIVNYK